MLAGKILPQQVTCIHSCVDNKLQITAGTLMHGPTITSQNAGMLMHGSTITSQNAGTLMHGPTITSQNAAFTRKLRAD
jgi:hypothetical protein